MQFRPLVAACLLYVTPLAAQTATVDTYPPGSSSNQGSATLTATAPSFGSVVTVTADGPAWQASQRALLAGAVLQLSPTAFPVTSPVTLGGLDWWLTDNWSVFFSGLMALPGGNSWQFPVPNDPRLAGVTVYAQAYTNALDTDCSACAAQSGVLLATCQQSLCLTVGATNALALTLGR